MLPGREGSVPKSWVTVGRVRIRRRRVPRRTARKRRRSGSGSTSPRSIGLSERARCRRHSSCRGLRGRSPSRRSTARQFGQACGKSSPAVTAMLGNYKTLAFLDCRDSDNWGAQCHTIAFASSEDEEIACVRIAPEVLLNLQSQRVHVPTHVCHAGRKPHPHTARNRDHRRSSTAITRDSAEGSTVRSTITRRSPASTISIRPVAGWPSATTLSDGGLIVAAAGS